MDADTNRTLDILFNPRNIAIYKASNKLDYFLMGLREQKFRTDKLYLVNPELEEIFGQKTIKSLEEIPEDTIDLLILAVGRDKVIETVKAQIVDFVDHDQMMEEKVFDALRRGKLK